MRTTKDTTKDTKTVIMNADNMKPFVHYVVYIKDKAFIMYKHADGKLFQGVSSKHPTCNNAIFKARKPMVHSHPMRVAESRDYLILQSQDTPIRVKVQNEHVASLKMKNI